MRRESRSENEKAPPRNADLERWRFAKDAGRGWRLPRAERPLRRANKDGIALQAARLGKWPLSNREKAKR
jgi:hypothetical protein